ncbi:hypothetical protein MPSEU_000183200 [Mayamaea pseudoterrestris]|nr:hypothetical protein MPSEU_000183200 [Mayamaea pseudoterrestris]
MKKLIALMLSVQVSRVAGFVVHSQQQRRHASAYSSLSRLQSSTLDEEQVRSMSVKVLKMELSKLKVSSADVFEKEELVARYMQALQEQNDNGTIDEATAASFSNAASTETTDSDDSNIIKAPIHMIYLDVGSRVAASNMQGGVTILSDTAYATLQLTINQENVTLLLDTAATGLLFRPSAIQKCKLGVFQKPVTVMAAGSAAGDQLKKQMTDVAELTDFRLGGHHFRDKMYPIVIQDLDVITDTRIDGIIGLSFLQDFAAVDLDFGNKQLIMYKDKVPKIMPSQTLLTEAKMTRLSSQAGGILYAPVWFGDRGPVNMLVDSGSSSTILSFKGLDDLGLDASNDKFVQRVPNPTGSLGLDKVVVDMTHRIRVGSTFRLSNDESQPGVSLAGDDRRLTVDIGNLPLFGALASYGVGGILGVDALMRSSICRLSFKGNSQPTITILQ